MDTFLHSNIISNFSIGSSFRDDLCKAVVCWNRYKNTGVKRNCHYSIIPLDFITLEGTAAKMVGGSKLNLEVRQTRNLSCQEEGLATSQFYDNVLIIQLI